MKKVLILMLGLVAGTASFAQTTTPQPLATSVLITSDQRVKLTVGREEALATVTLLDADNHVLYAQNVDLHQGLRQYFNIAQLDNGTYRLAVAVGKQTTVKTFIVDEQPAQKIIAFRS